MFLYKAMFVAALLSVLAAAIPAKCQTASSPTCGPNEFATSCYNECQTTCKNRITGSDRLCATVCNRDGCFCDEGYLRHDNGTCVTVDECSPHDCPQGEVYTDCGLSCPPTCESRGDTCKLCVFQCNPGCFCPQGTIRAPNGSCVPPEQCPPRTCSGPNEEFDDCPPTCPPTQNCSNIWSRFDCSSAVDCCTPQCRCKSGFYRDENNKCISGQECLGNTGAPQPTLLSAETKESS